MPGATEPWRPTMPRTRAVNLFVDLDENTKHDILRRTLGEASSNATADHHFTVQEITARFANRAREFNIPTLYNQSVYFEAAHGFTAAISDFKVDENHLLFPASSKSPINNLHKEALEKTNSLPASFQPNDLTSTYKKDLLEQIAAEVATSTASDMAKTAILAEHHRLLSAGATTLLVCPVPRCKRDFGTAARLYDLLVLLDGLVH